MTFATQCRQFVGRFGSACEALEVFACQDETGVVSDIRLKKR